MSSSDPRLSSRSMLRRSSPLVTGAMVAPYTLSRKIYDENRENEVPLLIISAHDFNWRVGGGPWAGLAGGGSAGCRLGADKDDERWTSGSDAGGVRQDRRWAGGGDLHPDQQGRRPDQGDELRSHH